MRCERCGAEVREEETICPECGATLPSMAEGNKEPPPFAPIREVSFAREGTDSKRASSDASPARLGGTVRDIKRIVALLSTLLLLLSTCSTQRDGSSATGATSGSGGSAGVVTREGGRPGPSGSSSTDPSDGAVASGSLTLETKRELDDIASKGSDEMTSEDRIRIMEIARQMNGRQ